MTLHDMVKHLRMNPNFCQKKNYVLTREAYLNSCVLKREISVCTSPVGLGFKEVYINSFIMDVRVRVKPKPL